ncbi:MAG: hypothetical protein N3B10_13015 [Armatimonadetes bacterium]|nr:hypothetical protein [Armatimonadota bacterium]
MLFKPVADKGIVTGVFKGDLKPQDRDRKAPFCLGCSVGLVACPTSAHQIWTLPTIQGKPWDIENQLARAWVKLRAQWLAV